LIKAWLGGNVFVKGAKPSRYEKSPLLLPDLDPAWKMREGNETVNPSALYQSMPIETSSTIRA